MYPALNPAMIGVQAPFEECVRLVAAVGLKGIAVNLGEAMQDPDKIRRLLETNKLAPAAWGLPFDFRGDEDTFQKGLAQFPEFAKTMKRIGATRCATWILPFSDTLPYEENFAFHRKRLHPCAEVLAEHGCRFGLEFVGPRTLREKYKYEFIHTQEGMLELCAAIGTGNMGLLFDSFHWYTSHSTRDDIRKLSDSLVVDVHINDGAPDRGPDEQVDNDRRLPGESGVIDLVGFLQGLKAIGYTGPVTPEPFSPRLGQMPPEEAIRTTAEALLKVWEEAGI